MKPHEMREFVNRLTKIAKDYGQTQQLRERIAGEVVKTLGDPNGHLKRPIEAPTNTD